MYSNLQRFSDKSGQADLEDADIVNIGCDHMTISPDNLAEQKADPKFIHEAGRIF